MAKVKFTLLIPVNYNDGTKIPDEERDAVFNDLYLLAGGYTSAGNVSGAFRMADGSKQLDQTTPVWVVIEEEKASALKTLTRRICIRLKQEAIYLERTEATVEFLRAEDSGGK